MRRLSFLRCTSLSLTGSALITFITTGAAAQTNVSGGNVVNQTWTAAGSPYIVQGDVVVPNGSFLHIDSGVEVQIASSDMQASLPDTSRVAITIEGELEINGTDAEPVHILAQNGSSTTTWFGLIIAPEATKAELSHTLLEHAVRGLDATNPLLDVYACEFANNNTAGVVLNDGAARFDRVMLRNNVDYGVQITSGTTTMTNVIAYDNGDFGFFATGGITTVHSSAAHDNGLYGFNVTGGAATMEIVNTSVTQNAVYGVRRFAGSVSVSYSNVWGNLSTNFNGVITKTNNISANPQYVNPTLGDLHVEASSVNIDAGTNSGPPNHDFGNVVRPLDGDGINGDEYDIGPYEYVAMPICGDAQLTAGEMCDDGAANGSYGFCAADCSGPGPRCGDNNIDMPEEECDDGNTTAGDGCDSQCQDEGGGNGGAGGMGAGGMGQGGNGSGGSATGGNGAGGSASGGNGSGGSCIPNETVACACPGGASGVQTCNDDGNSFSECSCDPSNGNGTEADSGCSVGSPATPGRVAPLLALAAVALWRRRRD